MDLRIKKTQRALVGAMTTLLEKESFDKITVNDLCIQGMISRSAFYAHFEDKYGLLQFTLDTLLQDYISQQQLETLKDRVLHTVAFFKEYKRLMRNLVLADYDREIIRLSKESFQKHLEESLKNGEISAKMTVPLDIFSVYYASGVTSVLLHWLNDLEKFTIEEMADFLMTLLPKDCFQIE